MRLPFRTLLVPAALELLLLTALMVVVLIFGWWLVVASGAQQLPQPSVSLHPSHRVAVGDTVTVRCHVPRMVAWVQLWFNGTLRSNKEKDEGRDAVEFSFPVVHLEDTGTYQCRYQVSEPLWTSNRSDPVELVVSGAEGRSRGNLAVAVLRVCAAVAVFVLGLYFVLDARGLRTRTEGSPGVPPEAGKFQEPPSDSEGLTYAEMQAAPIPLSQPPGSPAGPHSPTLYTEVSTGGQC